jgi:hypothetical protein
MSTTIAVSTAIEFEGRHERYPTDGSIDDVELVAVQSVVSREAGERDPLLLRSKIKTDDELAHIRSRGRSASKVASFYEGQNNLIGNLLKPLSAHTAEGLEEEAAMALKVKIAINVSFVCNILLAILQLYAAISSRSLALFASCVDSGGLHGLCRRKVR